MIEQLHDPTPAELNALTELWESSVRATHDFLTPEDIPLFRNMVRNEALQAVRLYVLRDTAGAFAAFMGIDEDKIGMLFVAPAKRGQGLGRDLTEFAIRELDVRQVDVNEQNRQAAGFYARLGFRIVSREATDPSGRLYPILHLSL